MSDRWLEVRAVLRCDPELVDTVQAWLEDSDLVEVNRIDVTELDDDLRRWDGGRPPGVVVDDLGRPEPVSPQAMDGLRRGLHLHEQ